MEASKASGNAVRPESSKLPAPAKTHLSTWNRLPALDCFTHRLLCGHHLPALDAGRPQPRTQRTGQEVYDLKFQTGNSLGTARCQNLGQQEPTHPECLILMLCFPARYSGHVDYKTVLLKNELDGPYSIKELMGPWNEHFSMGVLLVLLLILQQHRNRSLHEILFIILG